VEDITIIPDIKKPELLDKVEVPPAAPIIEKTAATSVVVNPVVVEQNSTVFDMKDLKITTVAVIPADTDEQPLIRVPPIMPSHAMKSGYCDVRFNVNAQGLSRSKFPFLRLEQFALNKAQKLGFIYPFFGT